MAERAYLHSLSSTDYLAGERIAEIRHEYMDGHVYAMAGRTKAHNQIAGNVYGLLRVHLRGTPCRAFIGDVKVHVAWGRSERFYYPDVVAGCESGDADPYIVEQPKLVVEVLSDSTERNDRSDKFYGYRRLASLEEYVLIAQDVQRVEVYRRESGWDLEVYKTTEKFNLRCIGLDLALAEIYEGVFA